MPGSWWGKQMIVAGVDAGSRAVKLVLMDAGSLAVVGSGTVDQGVDQGACARELYQRALRDSGVEENSVGYVVATGYGRNLVGFATTTVTEITCHAAGVVRLVPGVRTIVEVGGQDSKVIRLDEKGGVRDFAMNDRCAAGTGRFLEIVASRLDTGLSALGDLAAASRSPAAISSTCVVFAETEIIGLLGSGRASCDIVAGVQKSICTRVAALAGRQVEDPVVFTGGVARIPGMDKTLESCIGRCVVIPPNPEHTGALGAALIAARKCG